MYKKHRDLPIRQYPHPPFPSFTWVMTVQANPPSPAYAYGYIRNGHAHARARARARAHNCICLPARRSLPPGLHEYPPSYPHSSTKSPLLTTRTRTAAILAAERSSDKLMETVDYRHHDPPSRTCAPWHEGYTLPGRGASTQRQVPYEDSVGLMLPPFSTIEPQRFPTSTRDSPQCRFAGIASGPDDAWPKKRMRTRTRKGTGIDVVKINRLDVRCVGCVGSPRKKDLASHHHER